MQEKCSLSTDIPKELHDHKPLFTWRMTMQKSSYSIEQFRSNFSKITTIKELISLIKGDPRVDLLVEMRSLPLDFRALALAFSWDVKPDNFRISTKIEISFKLWINGECYEAPCWLEISPRGFADLEPSFITALKESVASVQSVRS